MGNPKEPPDAGCYVAIWFGAVLLTAMTVAIGQGFPTTGDPATHVFVSFLWIFLICSAVYALFLPRE